MGQTRQEHRLHAEFDTKFFVLRTPLLPFDEFLHWSEGTRSSALYDQGIDAQEFHNEWTADVQLLRARLRGILERPEIVHALFVASPSLQTGIESWKRDPDSKKGLQAERALVRYFARMSTRATPFGVFAGYSVGGADRQSNAVRLQLPGQEKYRTCTRLDFDYLFALTSTLNRNPELIKELRYFPNSSLYRISDAWHYVESRMVGGERSYDLAKLIADEYLDAVLERARDGATCKELVKAVLDHSGDCEISGAEAEDYIKDMVESQVLVSTLTPLLTGQPPLDDLIEQLGGLPSVAHVSHTLQTIRTQLAELDIKAIGLSQVRYQGIASALSSLPAQFQLDRLFQVDMIKPVEHAILGKEVLDEFLHGIDLLCRIGGTFEPEELRSFREAFSNRYEGALVPILEALDEEVGVGFGRSTTDSSPLLRGIAMGGGGSSAPPGLSRWHALLLKKLVLNGAGAPELHLDLTDFPAGTDSDYSRLPDSFSVSATLAAPSRAALETGEFELDLIGGGGPSGVRMFGRFCHGDPELANLIRDHLREEGNNHPNAIYAEVAYLPEGRLGNVLCRSVLREYEIPYLARSGAPREKQIPLSDMVVGVTGGRIALYSQRLQREVIPRLSNAHGFMNPALPPVYRFLCSLQHQFAVAVPGFTWGPLESLEFLPRVRVGRLVLALARWRLRQSEIGELGELSKSERFRAMQMIRQKRNLPRWVVFYEADNALTVDLDNPLSVDAFIHVLKRRSEATLMEMYPPPELLCVTGPEGRFHHELNVPFVRRPDPEQLTKHNYRQQIAIVDSTLERGVRTIGPGGEWLYAKLYGGEATLDELLTTALLPVVRKACASGSVYRWFFVRYADPHKHVRIRFNGSPQYLQQVLAPLIADSLNPFLVSGRLWKIQFDTYEREIERYGGAAAMSISEDIFFADSEAVLEILKNLEGDEALDHRWRIALLGIDRLLSACDLDLGAKLALMERLRNSWHLEFKVSGHTKKLLAGRFRGERKRLEALLGWSPGPSPELSLAQPVFQSRSNRVVPAIRSLRILQREGLLQVEITDLLTSYVHMHVNRLVRSSARLHELFLYDFLFNLYEAMQARERREGKPMRLVENQPATDEGIAHDPEICAPAMAAGGEL